MIEHAFPLYYVYCPKAGSLTDIEMQLHTRITSHYTSLFSDCWYRCALLTLQLRGIKRN